MKRTDLAYSAGLFDGEGCIQIIKTKRGPNRRLQYYLRCTLEMANEHLPRLLQVHFGGHVRHRKLPLPRQNQWEWVVASHAAADFLEVIYPYLILKKGEADVGLKFQASLQTNSSKARVTDEQWAVREAQRIVLQGLKRKQ